MQDIIQKIIEIDRMAQQMTEDAQKLKEQSTASIEDDKKQLRDKYINAARQRMKVNEATEKKFLDETVSEIQKKRAKTEEQIKSIYNQNKQVWVDKIYNRVLGR